MIFRDVAIGEPIGQAERREKVEGRTFDVSLPHFRVDRRLNMPIYTQASDWYYVGQQKDRVDLLSLTMRLCIAVY